MVQDIRNHYDELIKGAYATNEPIFLNSEQAIYIYFEGDYIACNQKFSDMVGYGSAESFMSGGWPFLQTFVANDSQGILSETFKKTREKLIASKIEVVWKKKDGGSVQSDVIMVPIVYGEHVMVMHFIDTK